MSTVSVGGEHDDSVHAVLVRAGDAGLSLRELEEMTGLRYRVLHNVTWRLQQQGRAHRLPGVRPMRYVASESRRWDSSIVSVPTQRPNASDQVRGGRSDAGHRLPVQWTPHPDGDARRASAIRLAESVLAADGLTVAHRREALSLAVWFYTEADGKWNTRYRSVAALGAPPKMLNHEHALTRRSLVDRLLADPENCASTLQTAVACCVLREEHARLTALERTGTSLTGWRRYAAAGIEVVDLLTGLKLDLEVAAE